MGVGGGVDDAVLLGVDVDEMLGVTVRVLVGVAVGVGVAVLVGLAVVEAGWVGVRVGSLDDPDLAAIQQLAKELQMLP